MSGEIITVSGPTKAEACSIASASCPFFTETKSSPAGVPSCGSATSNKYFFPL